MPPLFVALADGIEELPGLFVEAGFLFGAGFNWDGLGSLIPVGIGVTLYGIAYGFVHDVYIHGRILALIDYIHQIQTP